MGPALFMHLLKNGIDKYLKDPLYQQAAGNLMGVLRHRTMNSGVKLNIQVQRNMNDTPDGGKNFEKPDQSVLDKSGTAFGLACMNCGVAEAAPGVKLLRCNQCKKVHYCGFACAKRDRKQHKPHCIAAATTEA